MTKAINGADKAVNSGSLDRVRDIDTAAPQAKENKINAESLIVDSYTSRKEDCSSLVGKGASPIRLKLFSADTVSKASEQISGKPSSSEE